MGAVDGCSTESICPEATFGAWRKRLLPRVAASLLLLLAGVWWGLAVVAWIGWEKRFASAGLRAARDGTPKKKRDWASTIVDVIQFGLPTVLAVGLAIDGLASGIVFYGYPWSFFPPFAAVIQLLGAFLLFLGLPLFTAGAYLTGKYVYSNLPEERPLLTRTVSLHSASDLFVVPPHFRGLPSPRGEHRHASALVRPDRAQVSEAGGGRAHPAVWRRVPGIPEAHRSILPETPTPLGYRVPGRGPGPTVEKSRARRSPEPDSTIAADAKAIEFLYASVGSSPLSVEVTREKSVP